VEGTDSARNIAVARDQLKTALVQASQYRHRDTSRRLRIRHQGGNQWVVFEPVTAAANHAQHFSLHAHHASAGLDLGDVQFRTPEHHDGDHLVRIQDKDRALFTDTA